MVGNVAVGTCHISFLPTATEEKVLSFLQEAGPTRGAVQWAVCHGTAGPEKPLQGILLPGRPVCTAGSSPGTQTLLLCIFYTATAQYNTFFFHRLARVLAAATLLPPLPCLLP